MLRIYLFLILLHPAGCDPLFIQLERNLTARTGRKALKIMERQGLVWAL